MLKVNNRNIRTSCETYLKLTKLKAYVVLRWCRKQPVTWVSSKY